MSSKWELEGKVIKNKIDEVDKIMVLVNRNYIKELEKYDIPYSSFSEDIKKWYFVKRGIKNKRFSKADCEIVKQRKSKGESYRSLAKELKCSTKTIYQILKDKYL